MQPYRRANHKRKVDLEKWSNWILNICLGLTLVAVLIMAILLIFNRDLPNKSMPVVLDYYSIETSFLATPSVHSEELRVMEIQQRIQHAIPFLIDEGYLILSSNSVFGTPSKYSLKLSHIQYINNKYGFEFQVKEDRGDDSESEFWKKFRGKP